MATSMSRGTTLIIIALLAAEFTSAFELTMIFSALKHLIIVFGSPVNVGWMITAYLLVSAAAAAICGRLGDMYGRRRVMIIVLVLAMIGSLISATSQSLGTVIAGRALQGFAGAVLPLCYGIVRENFKSARVPFGIAIIGYSVLLASTAGQVVGGVLVDNAGWRAIFYASAIMALVSLILCIGLLPPSPKIANRQRFDLAGGVLFVPAIGLVLLGISNMATRPWAGLWVAGMLAIGIVLLAIWIWHELRVEDPLIDLRLLSIRNVVLANIGVACFAGGPLQGQVKTLLLQQSPSTGIGLGLSATLAAMVSLPSQIAAMVVTPFAAEAAARYGAKPLAILAGLLSVGGCLTLVLAPSNIWMVGFGYLFVTFASISMYASIPNIVVSETPSERTSEATGMQQVSRSIGGAIGSQVIATLLATRVVMDPVNGSGPFPARSAYILTLLFMMSLGLGLLICALLVRIRRKMEERPDDIVPDAALSSN